MHKIPEGKNDELSYLKYQFFQIFGVQNETVSISFQYYSSEWEEYVELEAFDVIENKARYKAVTTPLKRHDNKQLVQ